MSKPKTWIERKLENPRFKKRFAEESEKLSIAEQLFKLRAECGLSQAQLAEKVGTTASAISRYENANYDRYEIQTIRKIVEACGGELKVIIRSRPA